MSEPGPWPMCVFQSWRVTPSRSRPAPALAEAVEVLLAREGEARAEAQAPGPVADRLGGHARVGRLAEQPVAAGVEQGDAERCGRDLDPQIGRDHAQRVSVDDVERRGRPLAIGDVRRPRRSTDLARAHPHDPRGQDGHGHRGVVSGKRQGRRVEPLEAGHERSASIAQHSSGDLQSATWKLDPSGSCCYYSRCAPTWRR